MMMTTKTIPRTRRKRFRVALVEEASVSRVLQPLLLGPDGKKSDVREQNEGRMILPNPRGDLPGPKSMLWALQPIIRVRAELVD